MPEPVDQILLRFPGPVTFQASRKKWALMLLIGIAMFAMAVYFRFFHVPAENMPLLVNVSFWICLLAGGVLAPAAAALVLVPRISKLVIDGNGFEISHLFRTRGILWRDATGFQIYVPGHASKLNAMVVFDDASQKGKAASMSRSLSGRNAGLPDTYGFSPDDLARLMNEWRERALR